VKYIHLTLIIVTLLFGSAVSAQDAAVGEISPALMAQLDDLEATVMELRGLDALFPVERRFPTREQAIETVLLLTEEDLTEQVLFEETLFYRAFDFIDDDLDLWDVYATLLADQVAGFYNPDTQEMNVLLLTGDNLGDSLPPLERITYSHEFDHALQDQHFDLGMLTEGIEEPDQLLAVTTIIEGDATLLMQDYMLVLLQDEPGLAFHLLGTILSLGVEVPEGTPAILEAELTMPYVQGMEFVATLRNRGGWEAVNAAFADPPVSTEQVLHPELYLSGEAPMVMEVADMSALLGDGWQVVLTRTLGEFYLREYLDVQLGSKAARQAAAGWGGDRYRLYYNEGTDQLAWILRLAWDTPADSAEFFNNYQDFAASRTGTQNVIFAQDETLCWQDNTAEEALCLLGQDDAFVAYAPNWELAAAMIAGQP
jgi:hypothetical protein